MVWWAVATAVWMITLSTAPVQEYLLAAACGLPCAAAALWTRRVLAASWTLRGPWLRPLLVLPVVIVTDAAQVLVAAIRPGQPGGDFETVPTGAVGDDTRSRSRRALATFFLSAAPGSYVLDADPETGHLMVHRLARRGPRLDGLVRQ